MRVSPLCDRNNWEGSLITTREINNVNAERFCAYQHMVPVPVVYRYRYHRP